MDELEPEVKVREDRVRGVGCHYAMMPRQVALPALAIHLVAVEDAMLCTAVWSMEQPSDALHMDTVLWLRQVQATAGCYLFRDQYRVHSGHWSTPSHPRCVSAGWHLPPENPSPVPPLPCTPTDYHGTAQHSLNSLLTRPVHLPV